MVRSSKYDPAQAQTAPTPRSAAFSMPAPMDDTGADSVPGFAGSPRGGGATKVPRQTSAPSTQTIRAVHPSSVTPQGAPSPVHARVVLVVEVVDAMLVVEEVRVVLVVEAPTVVLVVAPRRAAARPASSPCADGERQAGQRPVCAILALALSYLPRHDRAPVCVQACRRMGRPLKAALAACTLQMRVQRSKLARLLAT